MPTPVRFAARWIAVACLGVPAARTEGATFTVTTTADSGAGSLRQAILDANANPGFDTIGFSIPGAGVQTIAVPTALPPITDSVLIDGYTQPGSNVNTDASASDAVILIELMAAFLLKAEHGSTYVPPACAGLFADVACPSQFADWIEQLAAENVTGGCGGGDYCPSNPNTRGQMAVFLTKTFGLQ